MREEFDSEEKKEASEADYAYKTVMDGKRKSRSWSVASFTVSVASLICCCFVSWVGVVLSTLAITFAIISRKNIGYFDGLSLAGLIIGIFGAVFGVASIIFGYIIESSGVLDEYIKELEKVGRALIISPDDCCGVTTLKHPRDKVERLYHKGYEDASKIKAFLQGEAFCE